MKTVCSWLVRLGLGVALGCLSVVSQVQARDAFVTLPSTREGQSIGYWWMPTQGATATVLLLSGGSGGIGLRDGQPQSNNFLIRTRDLFRAEGFNVALLGNPTDKRAMDDAWRTSEMHRSDVVEVMQDIRRRGATQALWLVGTSRGTISATALAIGLPDQVAGVVLTAAVGSFNVPAAVTKQAIDQLRMPVLVYHHRDDACRITSATDAQWIFKGLKNASVKKLWIVEGGENPSGDPCEALHWHGFIGMEARAVKDIGSWIRQPAP
jgi:pimeloyl-ACP methyl ester carboxylesterase